jgi:sodium transport system permease protein
LSWTNVKLILFREVRDQLRDRRTLFMIAVLPLLLYPLLGMSFVQVAQFMQEHASRVLVVDSTDVKGLPSLVADGHFAPEWLDKNIDSDLLQVDRKRADELSSTDPQAPIEAQSVQWMKTENYDVVVYFPPDFSERLKRFRDNLLRRGDRTSSTTVSTPEIPTPEIYWNSTKEKSQIAFNRVSQVVHRWEEAIAQQTLKDSNVPASAAQPFKFSDKDVAEPSQREAALWSKILPFVLLIWALTGAFYPAIDLCAGEKERGTLETLLSSPAERSEIVAGKMLTVMIFSMATSLLNLASMGFTGFMVMNRMGSLGKVLGGGLGMPPLSAVIWMLVALVPVSALFSAMCIALAVVARSTKEGQYYLMPLVMITMPLLILPMAPGVELSLGTSLVPLTGLVLLLRMLLEGEWRAVLWPPMFLPVVAVTGACCYIAVRWAIDQFNKESVLFRESERLDLRLWLKHTIRSRGATPTASAAVVCGLLILVVNFFIGLLLPIPTRFSDVVVLVVVSMLGVAIPTALMTGLFTRSSAKTLLIRRSGWSPVALAILLAVALHPLSVAMSGVLQTLYPPGKNVEAFQSVFKLLTDKTSLWWLTPLLIGLLPAVCEELTFRGFILSGLRHTGHKWRAILLSSLFFAVAHPVLQQSMSAFILGTILAFVAVQTGSIWPGLLIHLIHNSIVWLHSVYETEINSLLERYPSIGWSALLIGALATMWILAWFSRLRYQRTDEETVEEAIAQEAAEAAHV